MLFQKGCLFVTQRKITQLAITKHLWEQQLKTDQLFQRHILKIYDRKDRPQAGKAFPVFFSKPYKLIKTPREPCSTLILEELPPGLNKPNSLAFLWTPIPSLLHLSDILSTNHFLLSAPPSRKLSKFSALTSPSASSLPSLHLISGGHHRSPGPASSPLLRCLRCCHVFHSFIYSIQNNIPSNLQVNTENHFITECLQ